jgi:NTE family protein
MAGLAAELRRHGVDLGVTDLVVGTSAGAIVGSMLTTGRDLDELASTSNPAGTAERPLAPNMALFEAVFAVLSDRSLDHGEARRRVGQLALENATVEPEPQIARIEALIGARDWPDGSLLVATVDAESGDRQVWGRDDDVPLPVAVAASQAFPGAFPPISVNGRYYIDGGLWSATNADLAVGAQTVVLVNPMAHMFPREQLEQELSSVGADTVVEISPDELAIAAFGSNPLDREAWPSAFAAGTRQARDFVQQLGKALSAPRIRS